MLASDSESRWQRLQAKQLGLASVKVSRNKHGRLILVQTSKVPLLPGNEAAWGLTCDYLG